MRVLAVLALCGNSEERTVTVPVIEILGLRKEFRTWRRTRVALDSLDLTVPAGAVHGFLGPNGAGKTTAMRLILGLARPTQGTIHIFGMTVPDELPNIIDQVGAVVEAPKFSPNLSGQKNLMLLAGCRRNDRSRVQETLEIVGLARRGADPYKAYSLGMKQRLAIAASLLNSPRLLILDEPTNGLDPAGMKEVRDLITRLADQGVTVLLSSHILAEVQHVCTSVTIISRGRTLASAPVGELLGATPVAYRVGVTDYAGAEAAFEQRGLPVSQDPSGQLVVQTTSAQDIVGVLAAADIPLTELHPVGRDLESLYLELTAGTELGKEHGR